MALLQSLRHLFHLCELWYSSVMRQSCCQFFFCSLFFFCFKVVSFSLLLLFQFVTFTSCSSLYSHSFSSLPILLLKHLGREELTLVLTLVSTLQLDVDRNACASLNLIKRIYCHLFWNNCRVEKTSLNQVTLVLKTFLSNFKSSDLFFLGFRCFTSKYQTLKRDRYLDLLRSQMLKLIMRIIPCICLLINFGNKLSPITNKTTQVFYKSVSFFCHWL